MASPELAGFRAAARSRGVSLNLTRGDVTVELPFNGLIGAKEYRVANGIGVFVDHSSHDILIAAADYSIDGTNRTTPQTGDVISTRNADQERTLSYTVAFPDPTRPPFRRSDSAGDVLRIHTVLTGDENE